MRSVLDFLAIMIIFSLAAFVEGMSPEMREKIEAGIWGGGVLRSEETVVPAQHPMVAVSPERGHRILAPTTEHDGYLHKVAVPNTVSSREPLLHRFPVTFYTNEQGWPPGDEVTASGDETRSGMVACPTIFPFGTRFIVLMPWGPEEFVCQDRFADPAYWGLDIWVPNEIEGNKWMGEAWAIILFDSRPLEEYGIILEGR